MVSCGNLSVLNLMHGFKAENQNCNPRMRRRTKNSCQL
nr:MAG TPA: hypothetical protein [Bacteriophage sp.]